MKRRRNRQKFRLQIRTEILGGAQSACFWWVTRGLFWSKHGKTQSHYSARGPWASWRRLSAVVCGILACAVALFMLTTPPAPLAKTGRAELKHERGDGGILVNSSYTARLSHTPHRISLLTIWDFSSFKFDFEIRSKKLCWLCSHKRIVIITWSVSTMLRSDCAATYRGLYCTKYKYGARFGSKHLR